MKQTRRFACAWVLTGWLLIGGPGATAQETGGRAFDFGGAAGMATGSGLSFRTWNDNFGLQFTGLPIVTVTSQSGSLGMAALWAFQDYHWTKFYSFFGGSTAASRHFHYSYSEEKTKKTLEITGDAALVAGFGLEFVLVDHLVFNIGAGYGLGYRTGYQENNTNGFGTQFAVETGFYYRIQP